MTIILPDGTNVHCHRFVLSVGSEVFWRMFNSEMVEGNSRKVEIREVDSRAMEQMLMYLYTGHCDITDTNFLSIRACADQYCVSSLVNCSNRWVLLHFYLRCL